MFEKSLYDLIRGLRNHKGNEKEYIQNCLKECRTEIRSQDMDLKATALLKLIYLEMVGHDMSWASFHVLEVMSSAKYHQKRVGYLGAVQTFRPDTEVLMLATNLLKKDLSATAPTVISLPIAALPHIITPSLALSVLADLLPRLSHSHPAIRKKTIVTLYRLALVYPETLRAAWPKIKERLMDKGEDPSVTAAIVNVFATLTPLEPRLVRKLLPPLTDLIKTTPAMSLLYECINGIIQGGILGDAGDFSEREEIASLCVSKLRGMISTNSDPNLKYVALLAFNRIVITHPFLVAQQEDVILECIDSEDITIRIKALDLVQGMVSSDNLVSIVSRLMRQLKISSSLAEQQQKGHLKAETETDSSDEASAAGGRKPKSPDQPPPLPEDYTIDVIGRILHMCSNDNYASLVDFDWYLDVLAQLVRIAPAPRLKDLDADFSSQTPKHSATDISEKVGNEIRNIAVKVNAMRPTAVQAAELIITRLYRLSSESVSYKVVSGALKPVAYVAGEYAFQLSSADDTLGQLLHLLPRIGNPEILTTCLQAVIKLFSYVAGDDRASWTAERKSTMSLLMACVIRALEPLASHPYLEVQERAVEFTELLKLTAEAASGQAPSTDELVQDPPLLLTQAIPSLFNGWELKSVARGAQQNVPIPNGLDLDEPIHANLNSLLAQADSLIIPEQDDDEFQAYYNQKPPATSVSSEPAILRIADAPEEVSGSYQQAGEESYLDADIIARRKVERQERNRDDPFYIQESGRPGGTSTPIHNILQKENGPDLDIDSIPIMKLDLASVDTSIAKRATADRPLSAPFSRPKPRQRVVVAADESLGSGPSTPRHYESENNSDSFTKSKAKKLKQSLLQVDSSHLGHLDLDATGQSGEVGYDPEKQQQEEAEMVQAMKEVQRLRLEMQRANERIQVAQGVPVEGIVVKRKKPKKNKTDVEGAEAGEEGVAKVKKKKKKAAAVEGGEPAAEGSAAGEVKVKKKKKRIVQLDDGAGGS
ncbi:hypothetical protein OQA88_6417 [Cercophora sp. LCS_1]